MNARQNIESIIAALESLGYALSDEIFDFNSAPSCKMDKIFRLETGTERVSEESGHRVVKTKLVYIWAAYRLAPVKGSKKAAFLASIDGQDAIEDQLLQTLEEIPSMVLNTLVSKSFADYLIVQVAFSFDYWRDLS
jgi:hypothetical protein